MSRTGDDNSFCAPVPGLYQPTPPSTGSLRLRSATLPSTSLCYASFDFALLRFLRLRYATLRTGSLPIIRGTAESRSPLRRGVQGIQRPPFSSLRSSQSLHAFEDCPGIVHGFPSEDCQRILDVIRGADTVKDAGDAGGAGQAPQRLSRQGFAAFFFREESVECCGDGLQVLRTLLCRFLSRDFE